MFQFRGREVSFFLAFLFVSNAASARFTQPDPIGITKNFSDPVLQVAIRSGIPLNRDVYARGRPEINPYVYASNNPVSNSDPYGLWSVSGAYFPGAGGAVIFGKDKCGKFFVVRLGVGFGGGGNYDPEGTRPGGDKDCNCSGGISGGLYGEANFIAPFISTALGYEAGAVNNNDGSNNFYNAPISAPQYGPDDGGGLRVEGTAGAQFGFYGRK